MHRKSFIALWLMAAAFAICASAQEAQQSAPEQAYTTTVINVWPGVAPGSDELKQQETALGSEGNRRIVNVTTPTLTAYPPDASNRTGTSLSSPPAAAS